MSNPFEDRAVKVSQKKYENISAYEDISVEQPLAQVTTVSNVYVDNNTATIATKVGESLAINVAQNITENYKQQTASQSDHNPMPEAPNWCMRAVNWIPIRWFAFIGGLLLIALPIVEIIFKTSVIHSLIYIYLIFFGLLTVIVEAPTFVLTSRLQLGIYYWFRLLSRTWGRASFYIFVSVLCFRLGKGIPIFVGIWMLLVGIIMFFYSRSAAKKYVRIFIFISSGSEGEELKMKFCNKFDELDLDHDQFIGSAEIVKVAAQGGRTLSNAERHAIETFLDVSCNGRISKTDWWKQFSIYNVEQRYL